MIWKHGYNLHRDQFIQEYGEGMVHEFLYLVGPEKSTPPTRAVGRTGEAPGNPQIH